jgi:hypothetical protein
VPRAAEFEPRAGKYAEWVIAWAVKDERGGATELLIRLMQYMSTVALTRQVLMRCFEASTTPMTETQILSKLTIASVRRFRD